MSQITPKQCRLVGIYRPRKKPPGFGVPVFVSRKHLLVQDIDQHDKVRGFQFCDLVAGDLKVLSKSAEDAYQQIGQSALYAFQHFDGNIWIGHREHLRNKLMPLRQFFIKTPFVLEDIADFLGDASLQKIANDLAKLEMSSVQFEIKTIATQFEHTRRKIAAIQKKALAKLEQIKARSSSEEAQLDLATATDVKFHIMQNLGQSGMSIQQIHEMLVGYGYKLTINQLRKCLDELMQLEINISEHAQLFKIPKPTVTVLEESSD